MALKVAVQMDPLETINVAGDSTFAIMLSGQARGHELWHYAAGDLSYRGGRLTAPARRVSVRRGEDGHFTALEERKLDLGADIDVVLMRQDPPFDLAYITATHLLERIQDETLVVNDPAAVRNAPEKLFVLDYAEFMPPTLVTRSLDEARAFHAEHQEVVVKPLYGNAGSAVFHVGKADANLAALTELFGQVWREPFMAQARRDPLQPRCRRQGCADRTDPARARDLREDRPRTGAARAGVRRHRRHRRLSDRDQRHIADRHRRDRSLQRHRYGGSDLGRDRSAPKGALIQ
jgi:hypothetical protein